MSYTKWKYQESDSASKGFLSWLPGIRDQMVDLEATTSVCPWFVCPWFAVEAYSRGAGLVTTMASNTGSQCSRCSMK